MHIFNQEQWWSNYSIQKSQKGQCEALGGRKI